MRIPICFGLQGRLINRKCTDGEELKTAEARRKRTTEERLERLKKVLCRARSQTWQRNSKDPGVQELQERRKEPRWRSRTTRKKKVVVKVENFEEEKKQRWSLIITRKKKRSAVKFENYKKEESRGGERGSQERRKEEAATAAEKNSGGSTP